MTRLRQRLGVDTFQRVCDRVVAVCQAAGLVWGKELFVDGTKVRAHADVDSLTPRFAQAAREHSTQLCAADPAPDPDPAPPDAAGADQPAPADATTAPAAAGGEDGGGARASGPQAPVADALADVPGAAAAAAPTALPFAGTPAEQAHRAAEKQAQGKHLEQRRLDPNRPPSGAPGGYRRSTDFRVSTTDPEATPLNTSDSGRLGDHDHYAVEGGKARIIVGVLVTPAEVQDNQALLDVLDRARFRFHLQVKRAVADSKYSTGENLRGLALRGIRAYMPLADHEQASPFFKHKACTDDPATDTYRCPQGATLTFRGNSSTTRSSRYEAPAAVCAACPLRSRCTDSSQGRVLSRPFEEDYREELRQRQTTEAHKKALRKRPVWVEPLFGEAKEWHQLRRCLLRGLANVNMQALLVATGQNLKRDLAAMTRGPRPAVGQRAAVRFPAQWCRQRRSGCRRTRHFQRAGRFLVRRLCAGFDGATGGTIGGPAADATGPAWFLFDDWATRLQRHFRCLAEAEVCTDPLWTEEASLEGRPRGISEGIL